MKKYEIISRIINAKLIAIIRVDNIIRAETIVKACIEGGIDIVEISYNSIGASDIISSIKETFSNQIIVGAGTVLDEVTARIAILSGCDFIISPNFSVEVARICNLYQIPYGPGCTSLSEITYSLSNGASFIKAFPMSDFYGPKLVNIIKTPLPQTIIMASGGVNLDNINTWLENGVDIIGIGSLLSVGDYNTIKNNAILLRKSIDDYKLNLTHKSM